MRLKQLAIFCVIATTGVMLSCHGQRDSAAPASNAGPTSAAAVNSSATTQPSDLFAGYFHYAPARDKHDGADITRQNTICMACHATTDTLTMHTSSGVTLSCIDCHGGPSDPKLQTIVKQNKGAAQAFEALKRQDYEKLKHQAHVHPSHPENWKTNGDQQISYAALVNENLDFVRFINPADLRAARVACASCHAQYAHDVPRSLMTHGAMLWEAALYNNGAIDRKGALYGDVYGEDGRPAILLADKASWPTRSDVRDRGRLTTLYPFPRWEITQPGNILRVFERGGLFPPNLGIPNPEDPPGRPDVKLSVRGFGTNLRTDPVFIGLQKTRLLDPTLNMLGTNDHPGDFRSSGCSACHVVYANDRSPLHSPLWAGFGNRGESFSTDTTMNPLSGAATQPTTQPYPNPNGFNRKLGAGIHPIKHVFVKNPPTSTCIVCHVHPGTNVLNSYLGYMWWDNESDGWFMYPRKQVNPTSQQDFDASQHNPEAAAARGLWSDLYPNLENHKGQKAGKDFLEKLTRLNPKLQHNQFADFHGHGWVFRAVFKQDREGQLLDYSNQPVDPNPATIAARMDQGVKFAQVKDGDPKHPPAGVPVHLKDIHLEKGMQCVDCHFSIDVHGNGKLYGETRDAVTVTCEYCHGTVETLSPVLRYLLAKANLDDDGAKKLLNTVAAPFVANINISDDQKEKFINEHFKSIDLGEVDHPVLRQISLTHNQSDSLVQASILATKETREFWVVPQTSSTTQLDFKVNDADNDAEAKRRGDIARYAHTVRRTGYWGTLPKEDEKGSRWELAHSSDRVSCYACHSSWNTSCFGCHLPQRANQEKQMLHNEGIFTRNYTNYNYQTLRNDIYMLGVDATAKQHKIVPVRSACAVVVSSQNANRAWSYSQQQTVSAEGYAGTSFSPNFPHTVRSKETKQCSDCHISKDNDNNAIMAELLMQGTHAVNFIGRYAWVAEGGGGLEAVAVTEHDEPQAVIGSRLHEMAYPDNFSKHKNYGGRLTEAYHHEGDVLDVQLRGEYLYAACGSHGFIAYDVANIDNKDFSERITTAPVSPLGQRFYVPSRYATSICSPSTMAIDPARSWTPENLAARKPGYRDENQEGRITEIGKPDKVLEPHRKIHPLYGYLYLTDREEGLIVIGNAAANRFTGPGVTTLLDGNPQNNFLTRAVPAFNPGGLLHGARHMDLYGTYAYISCDAGIVVLDVNNPLAPKVVTVLNSGISHPRKVQFQFRYGFVLDDQGLKVLDVTFPEQPRLVMSAVVPIADARDLYICRTYGYVAAGSAGLIVLNLKNPEMPTAQQFTDEGRLNDATAVRVGMTNTSLFAYVADGRNGLRVIQLTSPDDTPSFGGFSPTPLPRVIAWYPTRGPAIELSAGVDRDRAVDESGNQLAVFGRIGSRPFTLREQQTLYFHRVTEGQPPSSSNFYSVGDEPDPAKEIKEPAPQTKPQ